MPNNEPTQGGGGAPPVTPDTSIAEARRQIALGLQKTQGTADPAPQTTWKDSILNTVKEAFTLRGTQKTLNTLSTLPGAISRGVANAGQEAATMVADAAGAALDRPDLGPKVHDALETAKTWAFGRKTDDGIANFVESATQFGAGWEALAPLKGGIALTAARGGLTEAGFFDAREAGLTELVARSNIPIAKDVAQLLTVKGDDGAIVARLKAFTKGAIPVAAMESIIAGARALRAGRAAAAGDAAAQSTLDAEIKRLGDIQSGKLKLPDQHFTVTEVAPDQYKVVPTDHSPLAPHAPKMDSPVFTDRAEAVVHADQASALVNDHVNAGKLDDTGIKYVADAASSPEALREAVANPPIDIPLGNTVEDNLAIAQRLNQKWAKTIRDGVQGPDGVVHVRTMFDALAEDLGPLPNDVAHPVVKELLKNTESQSFATVAARVVTRRLANQSQTLLAALEQRPGDVIIQERLQKSVQAWVDLRDALGSTESEAARAMRFSQERNTAISMADAAPKATAETAPPEIVKPVTEAKSAVAEARAEVAKAAAPAESKVPLNRDTNAVTASDFSLARAQQTVEAVAKKLEAGDKVFRADSEEAVKLAAKIREQAAAAREAGTTPADARAALKAGQGIKTSPVNPIENLSKLLDEADALLERQLSPKSPPKPVGRPGLAAGAQGQDPFATKSPVDGRFADAKREVSANAAQDKFVGQKLTPEEAEQMARLMRLSDGEPRDIEGLRRALKVAQAQNQTKAESALTTYVNFLLSGPKTIASVGLSGAMMTTYEPALRILAGALEGNRTLMQKGADQIAGLFLYGVDGLSAAAKAFRAGHSVFSPMPSRNMVIPQWAKVIVTLPSRSLGALDEFTRVVNYRARVRAMSLEAGRAMGLEGEALATHVEKDLAAAFTKDGIATVPSALEYSKGITFSNELMPGTFGRQLQDLANKNLAVKAISPFVKVGASIFDYTWASTPGLNRFNATFKAAIKEGGEAAAVAEARAKVASVVYSTSVLAAMSGAITGRAPANTALRKQWKEVNQEYSVKVGDKWISYRRLEPLSTMIGTVADFGQALHELDEKDVSGAELGAALFSSVVSNLDNKSYMQGLTTFFENFASGDPNRMELWMRQQAGSFVPSGFNQMNPDDTVREVNSMVEAMMARLPGYSEQLDPQYNFMGEPVMKAPGLVNRGINPMQVKDGTPTVQSALVALDKGLPAFPKIKDGINLSDREAFDNGPKAANHGVSPYRRFMELMNGAGPMPPLRKAMEALVASDAWKNASGSTKLGSFMQRDFVSLGGLRYQMAAEIKTSYENAAFAIVQKEYPKLALALAQQSTMKAGAVGGEQVVKKVKDSFDRLLKTP